MPAVLLEILRVGCYVRVWHMLECAISQELRFFRLHSRYLVCFGRRDGKRILDDRAVSIVCVLCSVDVV